MNGATQPATQATQAAPSPQPAARHAAHAPLDALVRLWKLAQHDHGGSRVAVKLLLGLYNGNRFPFDLTELRCLDQDYLEDALTVIRLDSRPQMEVHEWLNKLYARRDIGHRMEILACDWNLKGRCNKENERSLRAHLKTEGGPCAFG